MDAPSQNHLNNISRNGEGPVNVTKNHIYRDQINLDPLFGVSCFKYRNIVNQVQSILSATHSRTGIFKSRLLL